MRQRESGESLVELIVATAILGTVMVTIVGGFLNLSRLSGRQRDQGVAFTALTAGSEYAKNRACVTSGPPCPAESNVPASSVPHDAATTIAVSAPSSTTLDGGTALRQFVVTVATGDTTLTNTIVVR